MSSLKIRSKIFKITELINLEFSLKTSFFPQVLILQKLRENIKIAGNNYMTRPRKYATAEQRRAAKTAQTKRSNRRHARLTGRYFRLVIPAISQYGVDWTYDTPAVKLLRSTTVDLLVANERSRGLQEYLVAVERHPGSGKLHLDLMLVYSKTVFNASNRYDYLVKHGDLTRYRTVNAAILDYGRKQDPSPLGNMDAARIVCKARVKTELYSMMERAMLERPFKFDAIEWLADNGLMAAAARTNVYKTIRLVRDLQSRECNRRLTLRPGIRQITAELVRERLTAEELRVYHSWPGYATIVDHLNQRSRWGGSRPHKTPNLLVVGRPNTGKTRLALEVERYTAVYYKDVSCWFPAYRPGVYRMVLWNEFSLKGLAYPKLLNYLEGAKMDLEYKGGSVLRTDNPLVYMTSNMRLDEHICGRFKSASNRTLARRNLAARITEVVIPDGRDLFLLLKLIVSKTL